MNAMRFPAAFVAASLAAALSACASSNGGYADTRVAPAPYAASCYDCGTVESVRPVETTGTASGGGAVLGGIVGGVVGSQVGGGDGKKAATVAGVVGGALAGNAIEKNMHKTSYELVVRMDDGRQLTVVQGDIADSLRVGSRVRLSGGSFDLL
jgi:outer membrane lipoprotein SlyB